MLVKKIQTRIARLGHRHDALDGILRRELLAHEPEQMIAVDLAVAQQAEQLASRSATRLAIVVSAWSAAIVGSRILIVIDSGSRTE